MTTGERKFDVVGLGVSTQDIFMVVDELPGGELVQRAHASLLQGGGPVATALVALARLGARTAMIDRLGDDWRGRLIVDEFRKEKVACDWIAMLPGRTTSVAVILVRKRDGARSIIFSPGDADELTPEELPEEVIASARILHLNGRHFAASLEAAHIARAHGVKVSFDGGAHRHRDDLAALVPLADICIVAEEFATAFAGTLDAASAAKKLLAAGPETVVITCGSRGSRIFARGRESSHQPAYRVDVVDTTGAGDAYHGAFLFGILTGLDLRRCASLAAAVAAMNTRRLGGRTALPDLAQAEAFLAGCSALPDGIPFP